MKEDNALSKNDPSRYTVYQMLDYVKEAAGIKLIQKESDRLFLSKTEPYVESLYNYAHVLSENINGSDIKEIKDFFGSDKFRIKIKENKESGDLILASGLNFKDSGYIMQANDLSSRNYDFSLSENIKIVMACDEKILEDTKFVFSESFACSSEDCYRKFGFLDKFMLDKNDKHIKSFVLYENNQPVSTGAYFAFDKFSIENIGTIDSARGKGYASFIVRKLLQEAVKLGYNEACLGASEAGSRVYAKYGFEVLAKNNQFINY